VDPNRTLRIAAVAVLVLGIEWRLAEPSVVAGDPQRWAIPWAMLAVMVPVALGVWVFEGDKRRNLGFRLDLLWGLLIGTLSYCLLALAA